MAPLHRDPPDADQPPQVCTRCSKPILPGTASQMAGRPVHMRCLAREMTLETLEQRERVQLDRMRARAARERADELFEWVRRGQPLCSACELPLNTSRGVLFQGDQLVHA